MTSILFYESQFTKGHEQQPTLKFDDSNTFSVDFEFIDGCEYVIEMEAEPAIKPYAVVYEGAPRKF